MAADSDLHLLGSIETGRTLTFNAGRISNNSYYLRAALDRVLQELTTAEPTRATGTSPQLLLDSHFLAASKMCI